MKLRTIKLSGFKSFVDPTRMDLNGNLTGVVGPNGCGKSNIIDAVRWVMGESSAKLLRGESMTDVIFSGSSSRKPVSTATVELIFDNSDGRAGGEYASYNDISVKRQVSREGQSFYYLNNTKCRRRDITDLFLGTGLGPRSYSIIEQGMISKVVDARPEDLRTYLEEAAGISKYKERRRETENRIRHTRENLERLTDLRDEVGKHIDRLKRQAAQAERYKELKAEHREVFAQSLVLKWQGLSQEADRARQQLNNSESALQKGIAKLRALEAKLTEKREAQNKAQESANQTQGQLYEVGGQIGRLEQAIAHQRDLRQRLNEEYVQVQQSMQSLDANLKSDTERLEELTEQLKICEPDFEKAQSASASSDSVLHAKEQAQNEWRERWESYSRESGEHSQASEVEKTRIEHLDRQLSENSRRLKQLEDRVAQTPLGKLQQVVQQAEQAQQQLKTRLADAQQQLAEQQQHLQQADQKREESREALSQQKSEIQRLKGHIASLQSLQEQALSNDDETREDWLQQNGLADNALLGRTIQASDGWEKALESVLGNRLSAVVCDVSAHSKQLAELSANLDLVADHSDTQPPAHSLAAKVTGAGAAANWLQHIHTATSLSEALEMVAGLDQHESVVTAQGEWLGPGWARIRRGRQTSAGTIAREREIQQCQQQLKQAEKAAEQAQQQLQQTEQNRHNQADAVAKAHQEVSALQRQLGEAAARRKAVEQRLAESEKQQQQLGAEQQQLKKRIAEDEKAVRSARQRLETQVSAMARGEDTRTQLLQERAQLEGDLKQARDQAQQHRTQSHALALKMERLGSAASSLRDGIDRLTGQSKQLRQRHQQLHQQLQDANTPDEAEQDKLKTLIDQRVTIEKSVSAARDALAQSQQELNALDGERQTADQAISKMRDDKESAKLRFNSLEVKMQGLSEQMQEAGCDRDAVTETLPEEADLDQWQQRLDRLDASIRRLEPVNLAAIEEYESEAERKAYLDAQDADLVKALETLEKAIGQIDRKTRTRFKETYEKVNTGLQELFPQLFGGGHAYLQLTSDDLLSTGISIMARPPGKRVASIQLLSGGEKALTAVALVFAIFRLNPAPFCMLDEVDAPLDDANVGRFSQLVKEMSETVQFLFVTHNKITMEVAHQLSGVTMREAGVSRLVSVDIGEAQRMAGIV